MQFVGIAFLLLIGPAFFLAICGLLSVWMAFGRVALVVRLPIFLLATLPLGLLVCLGMSGSETVFAYWACLLIGALCVATSEPKWVAAGLTLIGLGIVAALIGLQDTTPETGWIASTSMALCFLAATIAVSRLFGFRLVSFVDRPSRRDLHLATGRTLSEWIELLDSAGGESWNYAQIINFLREYSFSYHWQKTITVAYETSLGRRIAARSADGRTHAVSHVRGLDPESWLKHLTQHRFTLTQSMSWSVAAALLFLFFRSISRADLVVDEFAVVIPLVVVVSVITLAVLHTCLERRPRLPRLLVIVLIALISFGLPNFVGLFPGQRTFHFALVTTMIGYAILLAVALHLVRQQGYRLVRLQREKVRSTESPR